MTKGAKLKKLLSMKIVANFLLNVTSINNTVQFIMQVIHFHINFFYRYQCISVIVLSLLQHDL